MIAAASSTKDDKGERDLEVKQCNKGKQRYFGIKAHVAVDAKTKLIYRVVATGGAVHDSKVPPPLLQCQESAICAGTAYAGQSKVIEEHEPWPSISRRYAGEGYGYLGDMQRQVNCHSKVRDRAEHAISVIKRIGAENQRFFRASERVWAAEGFSECRRIPSTLQPHRSDVSGQFQGSRPPELPGLLRLLPPRLVGGPSGAQSFLRTNPELHLRTPNLIFPD